MTAYWTRNIACGIALYFTCYLGYYMGQAVTLIILS